MPGRLRSSLAESLVLLAVGGGVGLWIALGGDQNMLLSLAPADLPRGRVSIDPMVLGFTGMLACGRGDLWPGARRGASRPELTGVLRAAAADGATALAARGPSWRR